SPVLLHFVLLRSPPRPTLFPYTTLFRSLEESLVVSFKLLVEVLLVALDTLEELELDLDSVLFAELALSLTSVFSLSSDVSFAARSEEHTSELQSRFDLVCLLLLEKINAN